jgi:hypothetical protein
MWSAEGSTVFGSIFEQVSIARGQRVWNRHPVGIFIGLGMLPDKGL